MEKSQQGVTGSSEIIFGKCLEGQEWGSVFGTQPAEAEGRAGTSLHSWDCLGRSHPLLWALRLGCPTSVAHCPLD